MTNTNTGDKAIVVLTQEDIDIALHALEESMWQLPDGESAELEKVHAKLMSIEQAGDGNDYQVK